MGMDGRGLFCSGSRVGAEWDLVGRGDFKLDSDPEPIERDPALSEQYQELLDSEN
jgi:hypothetical protein